MTIRSIDQSKKEEFIMSEKQELNVVSFVKLSDLTMADVKAGQKDGTFIVLPATFKRGFSKNGTETVSINLEIHKPQLSQVRLKNGNDYLQASTFHKILLSTDTSYTDPNGREKNIWNKQVLCRFVKGAYSNRDGEYHSVEVIFKQGIYFIHYFSYDDVEIFKALEEKGLKKINWVTRPDKIDFVESSEAFTF